MLIIFDCWRAEGRVGEVGDARKPLLGFEDGNRICCRRCDDPYSVSEGGLIKLEIEGDALARLVPFEVGE